ncbi:MAG TPA: patatin-like phospholipase family protein [Verrucomicrobiae bacterium]|nr:patatin-like phospholipase family protein [Verrucomicrobiae bacterium]
MSKKINFNSKLHRSLIFQGGGSLGAYEAGVYKALYNKIRENDKKNGENFKPLFDVVAGTSIGAINAAILVSYVKEKSTWEDSDKILEDFWYETSTKSFVDYIPGFKQWWDYLHEFNPNIASGEAARRYYSTKQFELTGVSNVFSPLFPLIDNRFMDAYNIWYHYDNFPLKRHIENFAKFPIKTESTTEKKEPRLLLVSVDVQEGATVTFDSYPKKDGSRKTEYGVFKSQQDENNNDSEKKIYEHKHLIKYKGIESDHVIASASVPLNYPYTIIKDVETINDENDGNTIDNTSLSAKFKKSTRYFWDGGILSNTPLREVINSHQDYYQDLRLPVPDMAVYVVDLHPPKQEVVSLDRDGVTSRNQDISFSDRTGHDVKVSKIMADYVDIVQKLQSIAITNAKSPEEMKGAIKELMKTPAQSQHRTEEPRTYQDLINGQFRIADIMKIDRKNDPDTISSKTFDFSYDTINRLIRTGYENTIEKWEQHYN